MAKAYNEALKPSPDTDDNLLESEQEQLLLDAIARSGVVAAGYHTQNRNTQQLIELVAAAKAGGSGEAVVCWSLHRDSLKVSRFNVDNGKVTVTDRWLTPSAKTYEPSDGTMPLELFELRDSYLIYAKSEEELDDNSSAPFALPGAEVEAAITAAFPVMTEQLRATPEYSAANKTYQFFGFRGGGYCGNNEVTAVKENADGSLTLTVSVASVDFGSGTEPYCELTLLPDGSGGCKYLSNSIIRTQKPNKHQQDLSDFTALLNPMLKYHWPPKSAPRTGPTQIKFPRTSWCRPTTFSRCMKTRG